MFLDLCHNFCILKLKQRIESCIEKQRFSSMGRVVASKGVGLKVSSVAVSKSPTTLLTCDNSTLEAKTLFLDTLFNLLF